MFKRIRERKGQGMTEYIIIVAVVAILSLAIVYKFGNQIRNLFWVSSKELAGQNETVSEQNAGTKSDENVTIKDL